MRPVLEFFVDDDRETPKRIVVHTVGAEQYSLDFYTQRDRIWQDGPQEIEVNGKPALARRLIREGIPQETVYDDLAMEAPAERTAIAVVFASLVMWLVIAVAGIALARWLLGVAL